MTDISCSQGGSLMAEAVQSVRPVLKPVARASDVEGEDTAMLWTGARQVTWDIDVSRMRTMQLSYNAFQAGFNTRLTNNSYSSLKSRPTSTRLHDAMCQKAASF
jgi:hypothetical protein